ncbi:membrane-targeted effector domain-containing toxin [Pseudomonas alvandae]|uniref:membrane-targeted effector domain-containing toxin n=1 Tax=Pseudomonas TaxID=286 RepID=UPI00389A19B8
MSEPTIRPPETPRLPDFPGLRISESSPHPSTPEPGRTSLARHNEAQPPTVEVTDSPRGILTAAHPLEHSLASYALAGPEGLTSPNNDGIRTKGTDMYVDLEDGQVAGVTYDPILAAYCAKGLRPLQPPGPALYRPEGETYWRENTVATGLRRYQLHSEHQASFDRIIKAATSQDTNVRYSALRRYCEKQLMHMSDDALAHFDSTPPTPRPPIPSLVGVDTFPRLVETLLAQSQGAIFTENYASASGKMQLIDNMSSLATIGVKTLYLHRFRIDIDQPALDNFFESAVVSRGLKHRLEHLDVETSDFPSTYYTYESLISAAKNNGIRIRALDCAVHHWKDMLYRDFKGYSAYHATQVIKADRLSHPKGKWVALIEAPYERQKKSLPYRQLHADNAADQYPNTPRRVELEDILNIRIEDIPRDPILRITQEPPQSTADLSLEVGYQGLVPHELPSRYLSILKADIRNADPSRPPPAQPYLLEGFDIETAARARFRRAWDIVDASQRFFDRHSPFPNSSPPTLPPHSPASDIFQHAYKQSNGLVLGAAYDAKGARTLLIENMQVLAKQQVKTLYLENLMVEYDQPQLESFASGGIMSGELRANLRRQDELQRVDPQSDHSLEKLVTIARQHGIKVSALDLAAIFRDDLRMYDPGRSSAFKYIAHSIIQNDQAKAGPHKWLALVASGHANAVRNTPGLAELQGAVGVRVTDVGGQPTRVVSDEGEILSNLLPIQPSQGAFPPPRTFHQFVKSDLLVEMRVSSQPIPRPPVSPGKLLHRPSEFLIENVGQSATLYLLSNEFGRFHTIPLRLSDGKFLVDIPDVFERLRMVRQVKFSNLENLALTFESVGMTQVHSTTVTSVSPPLLFDQGPLLTAPGQYVINYKPNGAELFHRTRHGEVERILIHKIKKTDKVYIDHPDWGMSAENLYANAQTLITHLETKQSLVRVRAFDQGVLQSHPETR